MDPGIEPYLLEDFIDHLLGRPAFEGLDDRAKTIFSEKLTGIVLGLGDSVGVKNQQVTRFQLGLLLFEAYPALDAEDQTISIQSFTPSTGGSAVPNVLAVMSPEPAGRE